MKTSEAFPSKFLKSDDLKGRAVTVTIESYTLEKMPDGARKPALYFRGKEKGMIINKTNSNRIEHMLGYGDDMDKWIGKQITIHTEMAEFQGKVGPALRVKVAGNGSAPVAAPPPPPPPPPQEEPGYDDGLRDEIPF